MRFVPSVVFVWVSSNKAKQVVYIFIPCNFILFEFAVCFHKWKSILSDHVGRIAIESEHA